MRFLFRSAFRSALRSPVQNIILIFTVLLSAVLFAMIAETSFSAAEETFSSIEAKYGKADICVSADGNADSSYIGSADISAVLGQDDVFSGYMVLPSYDESGTALGAVTDFNTIGEIFDFSFTEYGKVTTQNVNSAVFVTSAFAAERGVGIGDIYTVNVLGITVDYVVQGVNAHSFFGGYDFIINAGGVLNTLSSISPVFAVFDSENIPYSAVYVRTNGDVEQKIQSINLALSVNGWSADYAEGTELQYMDTLVTVLIPTMILFTAVIAGILVYFSLNIISEKRKSETTNFILSGMSASKVVLAFIIETSVYVALGTLAGLGVSSIALAIIGSERFKYATLSLTFRGALICIAAEALVEVIASFIYFWRGKRRKIIRNRRGYAVIIASFAVIIACVALTFFISVSKLYILSLVAFVGVLAIIFACIVPLCRTAAKKLAPRAEKSSLRCGVLASIALKNSANVSELHNVIRVLSVILSVIIVAVTTLSFSSSLMQTYSSVLNCDYVVLNAYGDVAQSVSSVGGTKNYCICGIYEGQFDNGEVFHIADIGDLEFLNINGKVAEGNEVYMPKTSADLFGLSLGDEITIKISGVECTLVLQGYTGNFGIISFFNAEYFGFSKNIILVNGGGDDYISRLSQSVSAFGAFVQSPDTLFSDNIETTKNIVELLDIYLTFMCIIAAIGAVNLVWVSYFKRRSQFKLFITVGMTRGDVAKMIFFEVILIITLTALISAISGSVLCYLLNNGMRSFGFSIF